MEKIVAILRGIADEDLLWLARAFYEGGIRAIEVTFDHRLADCVPHAEKQISMLADNFGGVMTVGAGTVLSKNEAEAAAKAGARLIISPDTNEEVIHRTKELGLISLPGALTPTEIARAYSLGADAVKVFPAGAMGPAYIKALRGPLPHIPLYAVGGVTPDNLAEFIKAGCAGAGLGGELARKDLIAAHDAKALALLAEKAVKAAEI